MNSLEVLQVQKRFAGVTVLQDISLRVSPGQFLTLLGPSGCGKTTLLRTIAGFERPDRGKVLLADREITDLPPHRRNIGMVFQDYVLFPHMNVFENIGFGLRERRVRQPEIRARVEALLQMVRLEDRGSSYPHQLSGGQKQRVALARALATQPDLLLMDEPLGALDLKLREIMQVEIKRIQEEAQVSTVFVTHDQQEALTMSDAIVVMQNGSIDQIGTPREIYEEPATPFVAGFVGKMNFLPVHRLPSPTGALQIVGSDVVLETSPTLAEAREVQVGIRPEALALGNSEARGPGIRLNGRVERVHYLGNHVSLLVNLPGGETVVVEADKHAPLHENESVRLYCPLNCLLVWADGRLTQPWQNGSSQQKEAMFP